MSILLRSLLLALLAALTLSSEAFGAHPEDDFCMRGPALCEALRALDEDVFQPIEEELTENAVDAPGVWQVIALYIELGYEHILPLGLDHILFIVALFFASTRLRPLIWQVSAFTVAHTVTLALAILGYVRLPGEIVEPIIAASIAFVAVENMIAKDMTRWRPAIVFAFGLFHGLGFAGVLTELGLPPNQMAVSLISFNVGVELGQLSIIAALWIALFWAFKRDWYEPYIARGASLLIAVMAIWWTIERVFLGG